MKVLLKWLLFAGVLTVGATTSANATYRVNGEGSWQPTGEYSGILSCDGDGLCATIDQWGRIDFWIDNVHFSGHCVSCSSVPPNGESSGSTTWTIESVTDNAGNPANPQ